MEIITGSAFKKLGSEEGGRLWEQSWTHEREATAQVYDEAQGRWQ